MRKDWVGEKVDISQINRGKEYTIDDNLEITSINSIVKNSIYASEIAEEVLDKIENFNPELASKYVTQEEFKTTKNDLLARTQTNTNSIVNLNESVASNTESINDLQQQIEDLDFSPEEINQIKTDIDTIKNETLVDIVAQLEVNNQEVIETQQQVAQLDTKVNTFDNRITDNYNSIESQKETINGLSQNVQTNANAIVSLRNDLNSLEISPEEIESLRTEVTQATQKVNEIDSKVDGFDSRITTNTNAISENTSTINLNTQNITDNKTSIEKNTSNIQTNKENIEKLQKDITDLNISPDDVVSLKQGLQDISSMKEDIEENKTSISNNSTNINTNASAIESLSQTVNTFDSRIENNTANIDTHSTQIANINTKLENLSIKPEDIAQLQQSVDNLSAEIPQIKNNIETNSDNIATNKSNIDSHTETLNAHTSLISSNTSAINDNTTKIDENTQEIQNVNTRIDNLDLSPEQVADLKQSVEQFSVDINNLQESVTKNTANIAENTENISDNATKIETNRLNIESNSQKIATNSTNIAQNTSDISKKQDTLVDGLNIKTINGESILGEGNLIVELDNTTFDNFLSLESENAVQNKIVTQHFNNKVDLYKDNFVDGIKTFSNRPMVGKKIILPEGYKQLTYVGGYFDQGFGRYPYFKTNMQLLSDYDTFSFHIKFKRHNSHLGGYVIKQTGFGIYIVQGQNQVGFDVNGVSKTYSMSVEIGVEITVDLTYKNNKLYAKVSNGEITVVEEYDTTTKTVNTNTAYLLHDGGSGYSSYDYLELRQFKNDILVYDLVPSLRVSDNFAGFYDTVNKVFTINGRGNMTNIRTGSELPNNEEVALKSEIPQIEINNAQETTDTAYTISLNGKNYALPSGGSGEGGGSSVEINSTDTPVGVANFIKVNGLNYEIGGNGGSSGDNLELLWENPNPTVPFQAQNINLSSSDYDYLEVYYYEVFDVLYINYTKVPKGYDFTLNQLYCINGAGFYSTRVIKYIDDTTLQVNVAYDNFYRANANNCVPYKIYGVKSASSSSSIGEVSGSSLPIGSIFASALPQTDAGVHLLDGSTIALDGIYADFVDLFKTLVNAGYNLTCTQEEYDAYVSATGSCGKFVLDEANNTLKLPKITTFIQGLTDLTNIGNSVEAGLPNITGSFKPVDSIYFMSAGTTSSGAFQDNVVSGKAIGSDSWSGTRGNGFTFDASLSSEVYGKSDTVQPPSVTYPYYIVLATTTKTDVEVNINNVVSELNNKQEKLIAGYGITINENNVISSNVGLQNIYSTEETVIGTWIDGKNIYRKIYILQSSDTFTDSTLSNIVDYVINLRMMVCSSIDYNSWRPVPWTYTMALDQWGGGISFSPTEGRYQIQLGSSLKQINKGFIIIEYTKTTD